MLIIEKIKEIEILVARKYLYGIHDEAEMNQAFSNIFDYISSAPYEEMQIARTAFVSMLREYSRTVLPYLLKIQHDRIVDVGRKAIGSSIPALNKIYDEKAMMQMFETCLDSLEGKPVRLSEFTLNIEFNRDDEEKFYEFLIDTLQGLLSSAASSVGDENIHSIHLMLLLHYNLSKKWGWLESFYRLYCNYIYNLNLLKKYQLCRDVGEEALIACYKDNTLEYAFQVLFTVYKDQYNLIDTLFYHILWVNKIREKENISKESLENVLVGGIIFYRNYHLYEFAEGLYYSIADLTIWNNYNKQRLDCTYFNLKLLREDDDLPLVVDKYLKQNFEKIKPYGFHGARPWLLLLWNIKLKYTNSQAFHAGWLSYESYFESVLDPKEVALIKSISTNKADVVKQDLIEGILASKHTRYRADYVSEIQRLLVPAGRLMRQSVLSNDIEGFLLSSIIKNDSSINFQTIEPPDGGLYPIEISSVDSVLEGKLQRYKLYIETELQLSDNQVVIWLFECDEQIYLLSFHAHHFSQIFKLQEWNIKKMKDWLKVLPSFGYNEEGPSSNNVVTFGPSKEEIIRQILSSLQFARLPVPPRCEILLICDIALSIFPHNLLLDSTGDFIAAKTPIVNILNPDLFIRLNATSSALSNNMSISAWTPIVDNDFAIQAVHGTLVEELKQFNIQFITDRVPSNTPASDINIFVGHGSIGSDGFRAVYTADTIAIKSWAKVFGQGKIAILFICHSGAMQQRFFMHQLTSLSVKLIELGYLSVIGSFWALNIKIPAIWAKHFLGSINTGNTVATAVHLANRAIADTFMMPNAWAAMHLFGSPNLQQNRDIVSDRS